MATSLEIEEHIEPQAYWDLSGLPRVLHFVADSLRVVHPGVDVPAFDPSIHDAGQWCAHAAQQLSMDAVAVSLQYEGVTAAFEANVPAVLPIRRHGEDIDSFLVVASIKRGVARLLTPERKYVNAKLERVLQAHSPDSFRRAHEHAMSELELLENILPESQHMEVVNAAMHESLRTEPVWLFQRRGNAKLRSLINSLGLFRDVILTLAFEFGSAAVFVLVWVLVAQLALGNSIDGGWFVAIMLAMSAGVAFSLAGAAVAQRASLGMGLLTKRLLLLGAFTLEGELIREEGTGKSLTRAMESDKLSTTIINLSSQVLSASIHIILIGIGTFLSPAPAPFLMVYILCLALVAVAGVRFWKACKSRVDGRIEQTHFLIDWMFGFRTMIAQGAPWNDYSVDRSLGQYASSINAEHSESAALVTFPAFVWMVSSLVVLGASIYDGADATRAALAAGLIVAGYHSLERLVQIIDAGIPSFAAATRTLNMLRAAREPTPRSALLNDSETVDDAPIISLRGVGFAYASRQTRALHDVELDIRPKDRILLRGQSGSGKSTLVSLMAGLREPTQGLIFAHGFDSKSLGSETLRHVTALAPQFHENAILPEPLAFNLLLGRRWPPEPEDLSLAEEVCAELGLSDLLERMPLGLMQSIGEGGWHLSHGEKCRVYLARTLLQNCPVTVLDESFSALDPETLEQAMRCVTSRVNALIVIEHLG